MPELPDVEVFRKEVAEDAINEVIASITVGTPKMLKYISPQKLAMKLHGKKITATKRHGKNLFLKTKDGSFLRIHFGMTGSLEYEDESDKLPKHTSLCLHFKSGKRLLFVDPRKFGAVEYIDNFNDFLNKAHIGPDIESLSLKDFEKLLSLRHGQLKPALMDQSLMSGLGNVYTDEMLYQAKIHPEIHIDKLEHKDIALMYKKMKSVIKEAIKDHAEWSLMPDKYLIHRRHRGEKCLQCRQGTIQMKTVGGRSTYFCNWCQRE
jgi:formamidopyrimidine-DNA glycosylase